ncbi:ABC-type transport system involved in multi-copper enzyme maturation permease subunit [Deinobacterium chartae]|uniref:ABC-type transport system involved in multi-copper enzyme maturation permease subunit n=1 Tax=Deinobacterium chartae TaxID=521158 RepID=A0A841I1Z7_9DEIO|nr:ABC transporter permease subunit [Deinobacterium chartae]MBB6099717.1 ABC-type transport system involved in multi-copper enzyme maturation permease subunit [Deinobacterium chartae]
MFSVYKNTFRRARTTLIIWLVLLALWVLLELSVFKGMAQSGGMNDLVAQVPEAIRSMFFTLDISTIGGYLNARVLTLILPLLTIMFGISLGNAAIAGEERHGQLDLLLSNPISRTEYYLGRLLAMLSMQTLIVLALLVYFHLFAGLQGINLEEVRVLDAFTSVLLLGFTASTLAMLVGSIVPHPGLVLGVSGGVLMGSYLLNAMAPLMPDLKDLQPFSVFYHYNEYLPIRNGLDFTRAFTLAGISVVFVCAGLWRFNTRDLSK